MSNIIDKNYLRACYVHSRPDKPICLAYVVLYFYMDSEYCPFPNITDIEKNLKVSIKGKHSELLLNSLSVKEEKQGLRIAFWCQSGMRRFKPTEEPFKNCVEVAIFGFTRMALQVVESKGSRIVKTDINYMTDLSPCPVCVKRLRKQRRSLKADFPNITFSYKGEFVIDYKDYYLLSKKYKVRGARITFKQLCYRHLSHWYPRYKERRELKVECIRLLKSQQTGKSIIELFLHIIYYIGRLAPAHWSPMFLAI